MTSGVLDRSVAAWVAAALACALVAAAWPDRGPRPALTAPGVRPVVESMGATGDGRQELRIASAHGGGLWVANGPRAPFRYHPEGEANIIARADVSYAARQMSIPTAVQWRPPLPGLPVQSVVRAMEVDEVGRTGPVRMHTITPADHGALPVVSLWLEEDALLDPDTGIYVVGNAMLRPTPLMRDIYKEDGRWWKYPGNFHFRGKPWERQALMRIEEPGGHELIHAPVGLRIHGNMTRGFPQKSMRVYFHDPLTVPVFDDGDGRGSRVLVLRAGGNDQPKAMMRDALLNEAFLEAPFEVSRARTCVVYINGAYWGLHHIRQRIDEPELARRYNVPSKRIAMLELELGVIHGDPAQVALFREQRERILAWDGRDETFLDSLSAMIDLDGFLAFMAAMMAHGNQDWPERNVKLWRYTGPPRPGKPTDGRWYFILSDADLAMGSFMPPDADLFQRVDRMAKFFLPSMFLAIMRSPRLHARFMEQVDLRVRDDLENGRLLGLTDRLAERMAPEMDRHTARWRKPVDKAAWEVHVEVLRRYLHERGPALRRQLTRARTPEL